LQLRPFLSEGQKAEEKGIKDDNFEGKFVVWSFLTSTGEFKGGVWLE